MTPPGGTPSAAQLLGRIEASQPDRAAASLALSIDGELTESDDASELFPAYSISKSFIAALLLSLCEEGKLSLEASLEPWVPELPRGDEISLRQLLNHSGGLPDYGGLPAYHQALRQHPRQPWSEEDFARHTYEKRLAYSPGEGWGYSNPGYMLAVRIAERASGESFDELLSSRILRPLSLSATHSPRQLADLERVGAATSTHLHPEGRPLPLKDHYHPGWVAHRFVVSRPCEIVRFYEALFRAELIGPAGFEEMTTLVPVPQQHPRIVKPAYGLGLMSDLDSPFGRIFGHNGGGPAYSASAFHLPSLAGHRVTLCVMAADDTQERAEKILFAALGQLEAEL